MAAFAGVGWELRVATPTATPAARCGHRVPESDACSFADPDTGAPVRVCRMCCPYCTPNPTRRTAGETVLESSLVGWRWGG